MIDIRMTISVALLAWGRYALTPPFLSAAKLSSAKSYNNNKHTWCIILKTIN